MNVDTITYIMITSHLISSPGYIHSHALQGSAVASVDAATDGGKKVGFNGAVTIISVVVGLVFLAASVHVMNRVTKRVLEKSLPVQQNQIVSRLEAANSDRLVQILGLQQLQSGGGGGGGGASSSAGGGGTSRSESPPPVVTESEIELARMLPSPSLPLEDEASGTSEEIRPLVASSAMRRQDEMSSSGRHVFISKSYNPTPALGSPARANSVKLDPDLDPVGESKARPDAFRGWAHGRPHGHSYVHANGIASARDVSPSLALASAEDFAPPAAAVPLTLPSPTARTKGAPLFQGSGRLVFESEKGGPNEMNDGAPLAVVARKDSFRSRQLEFELGLEVASPTLSFAAHGSGRHQEPALTPPTPIFLSAAAPLPVTGAAERVQGGGWAAKQGGVDPGSERHVHAADQAQAQATALPLRQGSPNGTAAAAPHVAVDVADLELEGQRREMQAQGNEGL